MIRSTYSGTIKTLIEENVQTFTTQEAIQASLSHFQSTYWPNNIWYSSVAGSQAVQPRTEEEKRITKEQALRIFVKHKPRGLSAALGDAATTSAIESLFQVFQSNDFCVECVCMNLKRVYYLCYL